MAFLSSKELPCDRLLARTGHFDQRLSAALQGLMHRFPQMLDDEAQGTLFVLVEDDATQVQQLFISI